MKPVLPLLLWIALMLAACAPPFSAAPPPSSPGLVSTPTLFPTPTPGPATGGGIEEAPPFVPSPMPALPEARSLTLEFPARMRAGDGDTIRLTLEVTDLGRIQPTAEVEGHVTTLQTIEVPDLYDTHTVLAEARLDLAGLDVQPAGVVTQPLLRGRPVTFYWSVRPSEAGKYSGRIWLSLRFLPLAGGPDSSRVIAAPPVEIEATTLWGLRASTARWIGALGSMLGTLMGFPFLEEILKWVFGRRTRRPA